jgi:hypothetical protein
MDAPLTSRISWNVAGNLSAYTPPASARFLRFPASKARIAGGSTFRRLGYGTNEEVTRDRS